jgi:hypothetical protein
MGRKKLVMNLAREESAHDFIKKAVGSPLFRGIAAPETA